MAPFYWVRGGEALLVPQYWTYVSKLHKGMKVYVHCTITLLHWPKSPESPSQTPTIYNMNTDPKSTWKRERKIGRDTQADIHTGNKTDGWTDKGRYRQREWNDVHTNGAPFLFVIAFRRVCSFKPARGGYPQTWRGDRNVQCTRVQGSSVKKSKPER